MIDWEIVGEIKKAANAAQQAEAQDDFARANSADAQVDGLMIALVRHYYGRMPTINGQGDWVIPKEIREKVVVPILGSNWQPSPRLSFS